MRKTVILSMVLALAAATPALARAGHHRQSKPAAVSQTDPGYQAYQPPQDRNAVPWAPF
jgi:hypothetical protein